MVEISALKFNAKGAEVDKHAAHVERAVVAAIARSGQGDVLPVRKLDFQR
jgi:hypothetical protein